MKIVVLFGSFNPMTNAHLSLMRAGMDSIQADKLRSLAGLKNYDDYASNIHFLIIERDGTDPRRLIEETPLLKKYETSFTILPPIEDFPQVSSSEICRRFYARESCEDLIPESSAEVLKRHRPEEFPEWKTNTQEKTTEVDHEISSFIRPAPGKTCI